MQQCIKQCTCIKFQQRPPPHRFSDNTSWVAELQIAASPSVTVVATEDVDQEMLERERQIELQKEDLQSKPENIRWVCAASP